MLHICTWLWGGAYGEHYVRKLASAVKRNLRQEHRFIALTDSPRHLPGIEQAQIKDFDLMGAPGCVVRLRLFDHKWQAELGIKPGDRVVNLDLDLVVTGELDPLFDRDEEFVILQGIHTTNPCLLNGSVWMFRAGERSDVWSDFSLEAVRTKTKIHAIPDDQGWMEYKFPHAGAWRNEDGIYGFKKVGWPSGDALPANARIVAFPGWRDPSKFENIDWIRTHWR
jgi:hypothetical protein